MLIIEIQAFYKQNFIRLFIFLILDNPFKSIALICIIILIIVWQIIIIINSHIQVDRSVFNVILTRCQGRA